MTTRSVRVLVVEDEANIRELVCLHLRHEGYVCEGVGDGKAALERTQAAPYDLMVLGVMLPGLDGLSLCRAIRNGKINRDVPILMLTARREEAAKVVGLESGADDYLTKPFGVRELVARARALLRRPRQAAAASMADEAETSIIHVQGIDIDVPKRCVRLNGRDIELTDQEFRLLHLLATHVGIVFSREALLGAAPRRLSPSAILFTTCPPSACCISVWDRSERRLPNRLPGALDLSVSGPSTSIPPWPDAISALWLV